MIAIRVRLSNRPSAWMSRSRRGWMLVVLTLVLGQAVPAPTQRLDWERSYDEPGETDPRSDGPIYNGSIILTARNGDFVIQSHVTGDDYAVSRTNASGGMIWETRNIVGDTPRIPMIIWEEPSGEIGIAGNAFPLGPLSNTALFYYQYHQNDGRSAPPRISLQIGEDTTVRTIHLDRPAAVARLEDGSFIGAMQRNSRDIAITLRGITQDGTRPTWHNTASSDDSGYIAVPFQVVPLAGGDFVVVGYWLLPNRTTRSLVLRFDSVGALKWSVSPTGASEWRASLSAVPDNDGVVVLSYERWSDGGETRQDAVLTRLDAEGHVDWERSYRSPMPATLCRRVHRLPDGGLVAAGYGVSSDSTWFYVVRTDGSGREQWSRVWGGDTTTISTR